MPHLVGKRIILREYRREDIPAIREWVNDEETTRYLSTLYWLPQSMVDTEEFVQRAMSSASGAFFVISDRKTGEYMGQADLFSINWRLRSGELGMVIGQSQNRGKGVGAEALELLLRYAFRTLGLERVELSVHEENQNAVRCYRKVGFVQEGVKRSAYYGDGHFSNVILMSILADEWQALIG